MRSQLLAGSGLVPQSAIRNRQSGISLTEVLIAMGVLTVGLLSVAAVFPVGGYYMRHGEISDRGSAIAQAAFNEMATRGMLDPENWLTVELSSPYAFKRVPREVREEISKARGVFANPEDVERRVAETAGTAFVIDPWGVSNTMSPANAPSGLNALANTFPITWNNRYGDRGSAHWWTWRNAWPMRRLTLGVHDPTGNREVLPMSPIYAGSLVNGSDDLVMDTNEDQGSGRTQPWNLAAGGVPLSRQSRTDYSWIATVNPTTPEARNALASDPAAHSYVVSVVVFHKRAMGDLDQLQQSERTVSARVVSTDLTGGELLLERLDNEDVPIEPAESPFEVLKTGQYMMVSGPHANSTPQRPLFFLNWYRVLNIDNEAVSDPTTQRLVAVRGPQWPWTPATDLTVSDTLSNDLRAGIFPGAVAVHSKTMRLEGS